MPYVGYCEIVNDLLKAGKVTGQNQSEDLTQYAKLNFHRMKRINKTIVILPEIKELVIKINTPQKWMVLTESWCGDAAQIVPILNAFSEINKNIDLQLLLRDENIELMDLYLTHGKSRSIPKVIVAEADTMKELFHWGPRPAVLQEMMNTWVKDEWPFEEMKEELHLWYAKDQGISTQKEIAELLAPHVS